MQSITDNTNNIFYLESYKNGIANEQNFCDLFNQKFSDYGFSARRIITETFGSFDIEILHNDKVILTAELKTRADKFFNESGFIYPTIILNFSKVNQINSADSLFIFCNQNFNHLYFYFNIKRCKYLNYNQKYQGRADRTEKSLSYMIPLADCVFGWENLLNFLNDLINDRINKDFSAQSIFNYQKTNNYVLKFYDSNLPF